MKQINLRKRWIVIPDLQYGLLSYMLCFAALMILAQVVAFILFLRHAISVVSLTDGPDNIAIFYSAVLDERYVLLMYLLIPGLSVILIGLYFFVNLSNRIAGPIYKIGREIKLAKETGSPLSIQLRKGDYFQDLASDLNDFVDQKKADDPLP